jgi:hypothetical protein
VCCSANATESLEEMVSGNDSSVGQALIIKHLKPFVLLENTKQAEDEGRFIVSMS